MISGPPEPRLSFLTFPFPESCCRKLLGQEVTRTSPLAGGTSVASAHHKTLAPSGALARWLKTRNLCPISRSSNHQFCLELCKVLGRTLTYTETRIGQVGNRAFGHYLDLYLPFLDVFGALRCSGGGGPHNWLQAKVRKQSSSPLVSRASGA